MENKTVQNGACSPDSATYLSYYLTELICFLYWY